MISAKRLTWIKLAWIKEEGYRWLASFLSLWLAFAYLWLAYFYPLMCAPYSFDSVYIPVAESAYDLSLAFEHTITPYSLVMNSHVGWPPYLVSSTASNVSWLLGSHDDATGLALTFINVISLPPSSWVHWVQPLQTLSLLHSAFYEQFHASPPERPPRLSLI